MADLQILFVDDEPQILSGLRRMLAPRRNDWDMVFASSGHEALELLAARSFDVLVSDMRMPGMSGAELLASVAENHPGVARIILSGAASESDMMLSAQSAHQYLSKPCERSRLESTIDRALALKGRLDAPELDRIISSPTQLPAFPRTTAELVAEVQSEDPSLERIGDIVVQDAALSAKLLQLVNSSFFGLARQLADPREAVRMLGSSRVVSLSLGSGLYAAIPESASKYSFDRLWSRSLAIASSAERVGKSLGGSREVQGICYMAGLLSVTGTLVLASQMTDRYLEVADSENQLAEETDVLAAFGATSAQFGAYILGLWGLPATVVETVAFHKDPSAIGRVGGSASLTAVHVASRVVEAASRGVAPVFDEQYLVGTDELDLLGLLIETCSTEAAA